MNSSNASKESLLQGDPKEVGLTLMRDMLDQISELPAQEDIDYEQFKAQNIAKDLDWPTDRGDEWYKNASENYQCVDDFLKDAENWKKVLPNSYIYEYVQFCFYYGFRPKLDSKVQRRLDHEIYDKHPEPEVEADIKPLIQCMDQYFHLPLPLDEIGVTERNKSILKERNILRIGAYIRTSRRGLNKMGLTDAAINKINAYIENNYGLNKATILSCPTLHGAIAMKDSVNSLIKEPSNTN